MKEQLGRFKRSESGQSLVEFALVLPILLILLVGIFDFGRIMFTYMHMHLLTQEAVRIAGLGGNDQEVTQYTRNQFLFSDPEQLLTINIAPKDTQRKSGEYVSVKVEYPIKSITPVIRQFFTNMSLQTSSTIRVE